MGWVPIRYTHKTELESASTGHVVAALCFLDKDTAVGASFPLFELEFKVLVTGAIMSPHHTLFAILLLTFLTSWGLLKHVDEASLALLFLAQFKIGVLEGLFPECVLFEFILDWFGEKLVKLRLLSQLSFTGLLRAENSLMNFNLIDRILGQAFYTKIMPTVSHTSRILQVNIVVAHLAYKQSESRPENFLNPQLSLSISQAICNKLSGHVLRYSYA